MKEICKLAAEKGFKAKTFSTKWALDFYLDKGKNILITETVSYLLLYEIQKWIRDELKINIVPDVDSFGYDFSKILYKVKIWYAAKENNYTAPEFFNFETHEEALKAGIMEVLKIRI